MYDSPEDLKLRAGVQWSVYKPWTDQVTPYEILLVVVTYACVDTNPDWREPLKKITRHRLVTEIANRGKKLGPLQRSHDLVSAMSFNACGSGLYVVVSRRPRRHSSPEHRVCGSRARRSGLASTLLDL